MCRLLSFLPPVFNNEILIHLLTPYSPYLLILHIFYVRYPFCQNPPYLSGLGIYGTKLCGHWGELVSPPGKYLDYSTSGLNPGLYVVRRQQYPPWQHIAHCINDEIAGHKICLTEQKWQKKPIM